MDSKLKNFLPQGLHASNLLPATLLGLACFAAYGRILFNGFVFDDFLHIITRHDVIDSFKPSGGLFGRDLTYGIWRVTFLVFGLNPLPYHALSLLAHFGNALLLFHILGRLLPSLYPTSAQKDGFHYLPLAVSLLFAVHPLASEAVSYATQLSIQLCSFFSLLAVYALLRLSSSGNSRWLFAMVAASLLAFQAKQPGFFHLVITLFFVGIVLKGGPRDRACRWWRIATPLQRGFAVASFLALMAFAFDFWISRLLFRNDGSEKIFAYLLTQSRVLGEYLWRAVVPVALNADHFVPWSFSTADIQAVVSLVLVGAAVVGIALGTLRYRSPALMFAGLISGHLLIRFLYPVDEILVEYRVYPSMPWIATVLVLAIYFSARTLRIPTLARNIAYGSLLAAFTFLTFQRTAAWKNEFTLTADVLEAYPMNLRAMFIHLKELEQSGQHQEVLDRRMLPDLAADQIRQWDLKNKDRGRGFSNYKTLAFHSRSYQPLARSLSALGRHEEALALADQLVHHGNPESSSIIHWRSYYLRARIRLEAGLGDAAMEDIQIVQEVLAAIPTNGFTGEVKKMATKAKALAAAG